MAKHKQKLVKAGPRRFYVDEELQGIISYLDNVLTIDTWCSCQAPTGFKNEPLPAYINMSPARPVMQLAALAIEHFDGIIRVTGGDHENPVQFEIIPLNGGLETFEKFLKNIDVHESAEGKRLVYRDPDDMRGFNCIMVNGQKATKKQLKKIEEQKAIEKSQSWA